MSEREPASPPGFLLYREALLMLSLVPAEEAGRAVQAAANYFLYGAESELDGPAGQIYTILQDGIDRNNEKYKKIVERNRANIAKRWGLE